MGLGSLHVPSPSGPCCGNKRASWIHRLPWPGQHQSTAEAINTLTLSRIEALRNKHVIHSVVKIITCVFTCACPFPTLAVTSLALICWVVTSHLYQPKDCSSIWIFTRRANRQIFRPPSLPRTHLTG